MANNSRAQKKIRENGRQWPAIAKLKNNQESWQWPAMAGNSRAQGSITDNGRQWPAIAELKKALGTVAGNDRQ